ncbi:hypothetical protein COLO4_07578 [Corchorus olitorius]|uniref:F-box associated beta-propeller type 1 domain-containing protein n=1 Tax=Corchorus olitorius TaxID=93759 RepID=A0A1R3KJJ0_9ROSI|nr:hypothetical protein COLO4_07578 [Corchorus olitorius]
MEIPDDFSGCKVYGFGYNPISKDYKLLEVSQSWSSNSMEDIGLWNPSTRKSHKLPVSDIEFPECFPICPIVVYGFGYDSVSDDYKLVRIAEFLGEDDHYVDSEVKVYSLKKKCWKRVKGFPYLLHYKRIYGVLVNNALHFVVSRRSESYAKSLIAAFDLGTEETYEVPLLDLWAEEFYYMLLGVLEGSLCMIANYENSRVDIWVMKEYGVKDSWTKLLSVVDPQGSFSYDFIKMKPLVYSRSKDRVLVNQDGEKFIWYDLTAKGAEDVKIQGLSKTFEAEMFVGSLVKLDGNFLIRGINRKNQQANRGKKKNNKKKR